MALVSPKLGLGVMDGRLVESSLEAAGAGVLESAYTQAGPIPGVPEPLEAGSTWRPHLVGAQSVDLVFRTVRGGFAGRAGAEVLYRFGTDTDPEDWRSWNEPNLVTNWTAPAEGWGSSSAWTAIAACVITESQLIIVTALDASSNATTWSYNPRTGVWTVLYDWDAGALDGLAQPIGMAYDGERKRLLLWSGASSAVAGGLQQIAYYSDDGGSTWDLYSRGFLVGGAFASTLGTFRVVTKPGADWLAFLLGEIDGFDGASINANQFASSDAGVTWEVVNAGGTSEAVPYPTGAIGQGFITVGIEADQSLTARLLPTARSPMASSSQAIVDAAAVVGNLWTATDADGTIYAVGQGTTVAGTRHELYVWRSQTSGASWEQYTFAAVAGSSATYYWEPQVVVAAAGQLHLIGRAVGDTNTDSTVSLITLGGWGQVSHGSGDEDYATTGIKRFGYGYTGSQPTVGTVLWLPNTTPVNQGWTAGAVTGTTSLSPTGEQGMEITCTALQGETYRKSTGVNAEYAAGEVIVKVDAGSSTLATIGTTNTGVYFAPELVSGLTRWVAIVDIGSDGIQVRDGTTVRATSTGLTPTDYVFLRWHLTRGTFSLWYRVGPGATWTLLADEVTITSGAGSGDDEIEFGCASTSPGESYWRLVGMTSGGDWRYGIDPVSALGESSADGVRGHLFGRAVPGRGAAYPLPEATSTSEDVGSLTGTGGPTRVDEGVDLPAGHTYPVSAVHPVESTSPSRQWRATGTSEVRLAYDLGAAMWHGGALFLAALQADFRTAVLQLDDGAGSVTDLGTLDKGWDWSYTRTGRVLTPRSGTATVARYFAENELVGGYVILSTSGSPRASRITRNSGGYVSTDSSLQRIRIEFADTDGTEDASGTGAIVHHSGVLVAYPSSDLARRYRVHKIAASQVVPEDRYAAGIFAGGRVVGVGDPPEWGNSRTHRFPRRQSRGTDERLTIRKTGPSRVVDSYSWPSGAQLEFIRTLAVPANYVGVQSGVAFGSVGDSSYTLPGLLAGELENGETPALLFRRLPAAGTTITDPTLYSYGLVNVSDLTVSQKYGTEGVNDVVSLSGFTFEQVP
jgi:hypothetical protein